MIYQSAKSLFHANAARPCPLCQGRGRWQFGSDVEVLCSVCGGSGEAPREMLDSVYRAWQRVRERALDAHNNWREEV